MARAQLKTLTEPMYYILLSLLKENHGYGIMQMVNELTGGRVVIGAGTLYSLLSRFEKEGIITQVAEENRRKIYKITELGGELLREEYTRLNLLVEDGRRFFLFEGERRDPPGGNGKREEESKAETSADTMESPSGRDMKAGKERTGEKKEKLKIPREGWNYGGAY